MSFSLTDRLQGKRLVVFDVDGTLYDQSRLRRAMAIRLLSYLAVTGRLSTLRALKAYRRMREATADAERPDFEEASIAAAAAAGGMDEAAARRLVADWMLDRPLPLLARFRYPGVADLFAALRTRGCRIGVLSDYPAAGKLAAMGLSAELVAVAGEAGVPRQKPDPAGLVRLMTEADISPADTVLIGDRDDRDGEAGRRAGVDVLIRSDRPSGPNTFRTFVSPP